MSETNQTFKRVEKKYRITAAQRREFEFVARNYVTPDNFGRSCITSVYLDTPDRSLISRSLEKPTYKEKLRIRAYGEQQGQLLVDVFTKGHWQATYPAFPVFFELKKKYKGVVYKRRIELSLAAAYSFYCGMDYETCITRYPLLDEIKQQSAISYQNAQIAKELRAALNRYKNLLPSMAIRCERIAWGAGNVTENHSIENDIAVASAPDFTQDLRLTFDDHLCYCDLFASKTKDSSQLTYQPIINSQESILEIKSAGAYPLWLTKALSHLRMYPGSFSKYGKAVQLVQRKPHKPAITPMPKPPQTKLKQKAS